jgi:ABC-type glycerol-3-phosphate transport system substrate-binding protein
LDKSFTLIGRAAFETSGRFGVTPVINKVVKRNKNSNYFIAMPMPLRFGNDKPTSFTLGFQFGVAF